MILTMSWELLRQSDVTRALSFSLNSQEQSDTQKMIQSTKATGLSLGKNLELSSF